MDETIFVEQMKRLATCNILPDEWFSWWNENDIFLQTFLNRGDYLRIKPREHGFIWVPVLTSQKGAIIWLETHNILFEKSNEYQAKYEQELKEYCKIQNAKQKNFLAMLKEQNPQLCTKYPRFFNSLKNAFSVGDRIGQGIIDKDIQAAPCTLPEDVADFFKIVSIISLDGISIDFSDLRIESLCGKDYIVLGEFWKEDDGDLLLIRQDNAALPTIIYYYCHTINKVKKLCNSIDDLMEKKFSYHNNQ